MMLATDVWMQSGWMRIQKMNIRDFSENFEITVMANLQMLVDKSQNSLIIKQRKIGIPKAV